LFGATDVKGGDIQVPVASRNLTGPGYAIFERLTEPSKFGTGPNPMSLDVDATWLGLKYGPHGGGHGHPDKNSFILYSRGEIIAPDVGTHAYGSPLHTGWDKTTLAHNTLVVDEKSQAPAQGKCLAFGNEKGVDYSVTDAGPIYPGVRFIRTAAMLTPDVIVFIDQIEADALHTFDLAYHQIGIWGDLPAGTEWSSKAGDGYKYFIRATVRSIATNTLALKTTVDGDVVSAIALNETEPTEVITGYGIWKTTKDWVPMVVQRRHAQRTAYVWAVSLDGKPVDLKISNVSSEGKNLDYSQALMVRASVGDGSWNLLANPERQKISGAGADSTWKSDAVFSVLDVK
jgi:hypothetical protein